MTYRLRLFDLASEAKATHRMQDCTHETADGSFSTAHTLGSFATSFNVFKEAACNSNLHATRYRVARPIRKDHCRSPPRVP